WNTSYQIPGTQVKLDYTGNIYSPMRLPLLSEWDPRSEYSPWWSIQNIQVTTTLPRNMEIYGGVKNLLNWTPAKNSPFIISRSHDPFDKLVDFDHRGRSEEHTSELQSRENLVCRLLLEKKKNNKHRPAR